MRQRRLPTLALLALGSLGSAAAATADNSAYEQQSSYSYVRTVDGRATLASASRSAGEEADLQQPLLQGDEVRVERGAHLEVALADRNLLRIGGDSSVRLTRVAFSADRDDRTTRLDLERGEILLVVTEQALGDELPEVRVPDASVFVHEPGAYRLRVDGGGAFELTVRRGFAEVLTERGSTIVRAGESAWTRGGRWGAVEVASAGTYDALERWSEDLDQRATRARPRTLHVEPHLAYQASTLDGYGDWVSVDASWYWRPRVAYDWRPYWQGRWTWTPSGMTWVSYEPWGWVPYHYGTWVRMPGYGWVWRPGRVYSPAWVYWSWGSNWTGWVPVGYYTHFYRPYWGSGFRFGIYGWAGGSWGLYSDWSFCPTLHIDVRDRHHGHFRRGSDLGRDGRVPAPHGIVTTDTRPIPRGSWRRPDDVVRRLQGAGGDRGGNLPEVTDFVARRRELPADVRRAVERNPGASAGTRFATPLDPGASPRPTPVPHRTTDVSPGERAHGSSSADGRATTAPWDRGPVGDRNGTAADPNVGRVWGQQVGGTNPRQVPPSSTEGTTQRWRTASPRVEAGPSERRDSGVRPSPPVTAAPTIDRSERQGWRLRGGFGTPSDSRFGQPSPPTPGSDRVHVPSAVDRVITGVRRNQDPALRPDAGAQSWRSFSTPPAGAEGPPDHAGGSIGSSPRFAPGGAPPTPPTASSPGSPRTAPPTVLRRSMPRSQPGSTTGPPPGARQNSGPSSGTNVRRPSGSSPKPSGAGRAQSSGNRSGDRSTSSPPPKRTHRDPP